MSSTKRNVAVQICLADGNLGVSLRPHYKSLVSNNLFCIGLPNAWSFMHGTVIALTVSRTILAD